jgi:hypothetical protein
MQKSKKYLKIKKITKYNLIVDNNNNEFIYILSIILIFIIYLIK